jgi:hypothetical protein
VPTEAPSIVLALPTPTPTPEVVAPPPAPATTNTDANLRGGPGTDFPVLRGAPTGSTLNIVGRSAAGDWFVLDDGSWVFAQLVDNPPANLPVVEAPAAPAPVEAAPAEQPPAQP